MDSEAFLRRTILTIGLPSGPLYRKGNMILDALGFWLGSVLPAGARLHKSHTSAQEERGRTPREPLWKHIIDKMDNLLERR